MFRLLAITQAPEDPCTRYRLGLYLPFLTAAGVELRSLAWPVLEAERRQVVELARDFDAVLLQRRLIPYRHVRALRARAKWLAYDFDDAVTYRDSAAGRPRVLLDKVWQFRALVSRCDAVTAGNAYLAHLAGAYAGPHQVRVVPTVLDISRYPLPSHTSIHARSPQVLGWIGQKSTLPYLERLREPLRQCVGSQPGLTVRCIADKQPIIPDVTVELRSWNPATEADELRSLDIGLAPLPDDVWTRGKCGLRLLQYLAAGLPAIASPVGTQAEIVGHGAALPARSEQEWIVSIKRLIRDAELRNQLVNLGRSLVHVRYVPNVWAPTVLSAWCGNRFGNVA